MIASQNRTIMPQQMIPQVTTDNQLSKKDYRT
jgi:hypothetical protein